MKRKIRIFKHGHTISYWFVPDKYDDLFKVLLGVYDLKTLKYREKPNFII